MGGSCSMFIVRMFVMRCVTLAVLMVSVQGAPQFAIPDQFQQFLNGANSNGANLPPLPTWLQDILSKLPTETASGRADLSDESPIDDTLKHHHGGYYGGYSKPSYGGYYGGYSNNFYNPYNSPYNSPYNAYNLYAVNPYAYNPYA